MSIEDMPVKAVLSALGRRLRRARLDANLTQSDLGRLAGVSLKTVRNAEDGQNISLETLISLLQGVGRGDDLELLLADGGPSPVEMLERQGHARQRATGRRAEGKGAADTWRW
jgi:putative transcriptional regulator